MRALITDAWARPATWRRMLPGQIGQKLGERYSAELAHASVIDFTASLIWHELLWRSRSLAGWSLVIERNRWFQHMAARAIASMVVEPALSTVVFAHAYSAREVFRAAKTRGFRTVLGQIDPGAEHFRLVGDLAIRYPEYGGAPPPPPASYLAGWREECDLADVIVVNSEWSGALLRRAGVAVGKLRVVPLPYETESPAPEFRRAYPAAFSQDRPLRVLYVGSATVSKGVPLLLEAMSQLNDLPVRLDIAGDIAVTVPQRFREHPSITWHGPLTRSEVMEKYRNADVLVFPSLSDGFGMAQVEAQGWQLPIIASRWCGQVVTPHVNGMLLDEVSAASIAASLRTIAADPSALSRWAAQCRPPSNIDEFGRALAAVAAA